MNGGAWWATVRGVAKSRTRLRDFTSLHFTWTIRDRGGGGKNASPVAQRVKNLPAVWETRA